MKYEDWLIKIKSYLAIDRQNQDDDYIFKMLFDRGHSIWVAADYYKIIRNGPKKEKQK